MATLHTDGTIAATQEDLDTYQAGLTAAAILVAAEAKRDEVQAIIDADADFSTLTGLTVVEDTADPQWVKLTFPTDAGVPRFWAGAAAELVKTYGAKATANPYCVRVRAAKVPSHLDTIRPLIQ
jgi:hypothetical protein